MISIELKQTELESIARRIKILVDSKGLRKQPLGIYSVEPKTIVFSHSNLTDGVALWASTTCDIGEIFEKSVDPELFPDIVTSFPDENMVIEIASTLVMRNSRSSNKITMRYVDKEFEKRPIIAGEPIKIPCNVLKNMLQQGASFTSKDKVILVNSMTQLSFNGNQVRFCSASTGSRIVYGTTKIEVSNKDSKIYIPGISAEKISKILPSVDKEVLLYQMPNTYFIQTDDILIKTTPYVGEFNPKIEEYLHQDSIQIASFDRELLSKALHILALMAKMEGYVNEEYADLVQVFPEDDDVKVSFYKNQDTKLQIGKQTSRFEPLFFNRIFLEEFISKVTTSDLEFRKLPSDNYPPLKFCDSEQTFCMILSQVKVWD